MHASGCGARRSGADVSGLGTRRESGGIHLLYWCSRCSFVTAGLMMKFRTPMISRSMGRSGRQAVRIWALQTNRPSWSRSSGNHAQSPTLSFGCMVGCPCQVWTTRADGHPQDTSDVIDERTQKHCILGTSDQTGLLGEFADHCILDAIPGLHSPARQFEGAEAAPVQQDALLAQQDRSTPMPMPMPMPTPTPTAVCAAGTWGLRGRLVTRDGRSGGHRARVSSCTTVAPRRGAIAGRYSRRGSGIR
ncbi:hypothetical protein M2436_007039 [Streptomyces sp. HB372]|nr:hypothetical protein [Streptomyces sp. HB372]